MMVYLSPMLEYPVPLPKKYQICIENGNFHLEFEYSRGGEGRRRRELSRHLQFAALIILVSLLLLAAGSLMWRLLQSQKEERRERDECDTSIYAWGKSFHSMDGYILYKYQSRRYVIIWYTSLTNIKKQGLGILFEKLG